MTQEQRRRPSPHKRTSVRTERNRPVLINKDQPADQAVEETSSEIAENPSYEAPALTTIETSSEQPVSRKLPRFFSTVGRGDKTQEQQEAKQARIARATKGKKLSSDAPTKETQAETAPARPVRQAAPRPASPFKGRYMVGMLIYLVVAEFSGTFITSYLRSNNLDRVLTTFNLFGGHIVLSISTVLFLIILIGLLFILARFDLIPRSFAAASSANARRTTTTRSEPGERLIPPTVRPGVRGDDDSLYQEYRLRQRRERKR